MAEKQYRDSVFRHYFIGDKRRLASLLRAVPGVECDDPNEIEIETLDAAMFSAVRNDVACIWRGQLFVLTEHQSTLNENMPLRFLFYLTKLLRKLSGEPQRKYQERLIKFPRMRFFVLYNGRYPAVERRTLRLSDAFGGDDTIELKVEFLNINAGFNRELIDRSEALRNYCEFVDLVESKRRDGLKLRVALRESIDECIKRGVMAEYFSANYWEVVEMYEDEYDVEMAKQVRYKEGFEDGFADGELRGEARGIEIGEARGETQGKLTMVRSFYRAGTPLEIIMTATGWTEEEILAAVNTPSIG